MPGVTLQLQRSRRGALLEVHLEVVDHADVRASGWQRHTCATDTSTAKRIRRRGCQSLRGGRQSAYRKQRCSRIHVSFGLTHRVRDKMAPLPEVAQAK